MARFPLTSAQPATRQPASGRARSALLCGMLGATLLLGACAGVKPEAKFPDPDEDKRYRYGSILGGEGGFTLLGPHRAEADTQNAQGIGVNSFLWRASLDTLAFMPIVSADPFGGVILTDWYSPPETPNASASSVSSAAMQAAVRLLRPGRRAPATGATPASTPRRRASWRTRS